MKNLKWDRRFLDLAKHISEWSKDPSTKIGAIAINPDTRQILSTGYNGFPRNIHDSYERLNNRELKYRYIVHGEMNAIYNAAKLGINLAKSTFYVWGLPVCSSCALALAQTEIERVVMSQECFDNASDKWKQSWKISESILTESGIEITLI